jgi:hypothetical protein
MKHQGRFPITKKKLLKFKKILLYFIYKKKAFATLAFQVMGLMIIDIDIFLVS